MKTSSRHLSIDAPLMQGEENRLLDVLADGSNKTPDSELMVDSLKVEVQRVLDTLTERERHILIAYFGLKGTLMMSLQEIAEKMNITQERVRQIKEKATYRLRHISRSSVLRSYLG
jgi:RNA polymerase primary sigma factor